MNPADVLLTGGCGFIGRHLARAALAAGRTVRLLVRDGPRSQAKARELFGDEARVEFAPGDLGNAAAVRRACAGIEEVYHVGGVYRFGLRQGREMRAVNVDGAGHVFAGAWAERVERVVHVSSAGLLVGRSLPLTETDFPDRPPRFSPYKASKWHAERLALDWARRGLPVTITCPPCPIGAEDEGPTPTGRMTLDFLNGRFPFSARTGLNFVAVEDLAAGLLACGRRGRPGERYVLGHENLWLDEFLALLSSLTGQPAPRWRLPWAVILAAGAGGELAGLFHAPAAERVCLETALKAGCAQFFDSTKAREELGWQAARPLRASLAEAIGWFRAQGRVDRPAGTRATAATDLGTDAGGGGLRVEKKEDLAAPGGA